MSLDKQVTDAQTVLRNLEAQKKQNKEAIAAQRIVVSGLQAKLGDVQNQIKAIDVTIALGGCVA
jgi:acetate kinase